MKNNNSQWAQFKVITSGIPIERFANAGLSSDGRLCFVTDIDEYEQYVWDLETTTIIWSSNKNESNYQLLDNWVKDGHIAIHQGSALGSYRLFGLLNDYPLKQRSVLNITIQVDEDSQELILFDNYQPNELQQERQRLKYKAASGDWAFATFSDDQSTIAVIEPYYLTFFRQK